jgi:hypothetical protein
VSAPSFDYDEYWDLVLCDDVAGVIAGHARDVTEASLDSWLTSLEESVWEHRPEEVGGSEMPSEWRGEYHTKALAELVAYASTLRETTVSP